MLSLFFGSLFHNMSIVKNSDEWYTAQGIGTWFWWDIWFEYEIWQVATIFGSKMGEYSTLQEALKKIGYVGNYFDEPT